MVPAPAPRARESSRLDSRAGAIRVVRFLVVAGVPLALFLIARPLFAQPPEEIEWKRSFLVGTEARGTASTEGITVRGGAPVELHLVVEGDRSGLPIYCTKFPKFRIQGRPIPDRMTITPEEAGLAEAEIHWGWLQPTADARDWKRSRLPSSDGRWALDVGVLPTIDEGATAHAAGTARYAVAIGVPHGDRTVVLGSAGWERDPQWANPDSPPGYRVSRYRDDSLAGRATSLVSLPVIENATSLQVTKKIAVRPVDLVLGAYGDLASGELPTSRDAPITGEAWEWLFEVVYEGIFRREGANPGADLAFVTTRGRGVPWANMKIRDPEGVRRGDVLLTGDNYAIADSDDGSGWLDNADRVLHGVGGSVRLGRLRNVPGSRLNVLRTRNFADVRRRFMEAGYGRSLGVGSHFDVRLERACREFQIDRGLPVTSVPDEETLRVLDEFLAKLQSIDP